jgi:tetratricopeptide (TPR) repeat protein
MWDLAVREEDFLKADSLLRRKFAPDKLPQSHRSIVALARGDSAGFRRILDEARTQRSGHPYAPSDIAVYLNDFAAAKEFANAVLASPRPSAVRDSLHQFLGVLALAEGRWSSAKREFLQAERVIPSAGRRLALSATFPFLAVPDSDLAVLRREMEQWNPSADAPEPNPGLAARLRPHARLYVLGLLSSRQGQESRALRYAEELGRMQRPSEASALVKDLVLTIKSDVALRRGRPEEALKLLQSVSGEIAPELLALPVFSEEVARYLRAEALYRLGRPEEALRWYSHGFEGSPSELVYLAPTHLRRGELYERLGDRKQAIEHYGRFIQLWNACDPALRPRVEEARTRLANLVAEPH